MALNTDTPGNANQEPASLIQPQSQVSRQRPDGSVDNTSGPKLLQNLSYRRLVMLRFMQNRLAVAGLLFLTLMYTVTLFAEFFAPYTQQQRFDESAGAPPQLPHFVDANGRFHLIPFVYGINLERDRRTMARIYTQDKEAIYPIRLFVHGEPYKFFFIETDLHLFGVEDGVWFPLGTDIQGRDMLSRLIYGGRISTTVGMLGVAVSLIVGVIIGMLSGYAGGRIDQIIQRGIEILLSFPSIPLWMALSAALPRDWGAIKIFFVISLILSVLNWGGLARIVRGMTLSLKNEEYVLSARMSGGGTGWIIANHILPANLSYVIVAVTLAIPQMILAETALSFLGLGIRPPFVSWGVLLRDVQNISKLAQFPWLIAPLFVMIATVLAFNYVGDGLRDSIDPFSRR